MAKRLWTIRESADGAALQWVTDSGRVDFVFRPADVAADLHDRVFRYGVKQILADAGALSAGASDRERLAEMGRRAESLLDGTWGERAIGDMTYKALVALDMIDDTPDTRAKWRELSARERRAFEADPKVAQWLHDNRPKADQSTVAAALGKLKL